MLQELSDVSRRMGLKMNIAKTKVMGVDNTPINVNNVLIENAQSYVYLGQHDLDLCYLWAKYRKSFTSRFIVSYNNAFRMLHNLHMPPQNHTILNKF